MNIYEERLLETFEKESRKLNELKHEYEQAKLDLSTRKIDLKYTKFADIKTIKEREERATLEVKDDADALLLLKKDVSDQQLVVDVVRLEVEMYTHTKGTTD